MVREERADEWTDRHDAEMLAPRILEPGAGERLGVVVPPLRRRDFDVHEADAVAGDLVVQVRGLAMYDQLEPRTRRVMDDLRCFILHSRDIMEAPQVIDK